jgi:hypothetical protein
MKRILVLFLAMAAAAFADPLACGSTDTLTNVNTAGGIQCGNTIFNNFQVTGVTFIGSNPNATNTTTIVNVSETGLGVSVTFTPGTGANWTATGGGQFQINFAYDVGPAPSTSGDLFVGVGLNVEGFFVNPQPTSAISGTKFINNDPSSFINESLDGTGGNTQVPAGASRPFVPPMGTFTVQDSLNVNSSGGTSATATLIQNNFLVPEPMSMSLMGVGLLGLGLLARRKRA